jgi:hypothetical protein
VSASAELADVLDTFGLKRYVTTYTRYNPNHLLDVLAAEPGMSVRDVRVVDAGFVSDHRLVLASTGVDTFRRNPTVVFSYRRIRDINTIDFERKLRNYLLAFASKLTLHDPTWHFLENIFATL